jgi:hypothetical protein
MTRPIGRFHVSLTGALAVMFFALPLLVMSNGQAIANPLPDIKINGTDNIITLTSNDTLTATIQLDAGEQAGEPADWWILAETPMGWYSYEYPGTWHFSGSSGVNLLPAYQGPLFNLTEPLEVLRATGFPAGRYAFYFGVDTLVNGLLDTAALFYDWIAFEMVEAGSFPVVDTGQDTCYNNSGAITCPDSGESFYGQDAQHTSNAPAYTDNGDGTITDNVTGLMWQQDPGAKMTWDEAAGGADSFDFAGYTDWRLPTIKELYSLILFSGIDPSGYGGTDTTGLVPFMDADYFDFEYGDTSAGDRLIDSQWTTSTVYNATVMNGQECFFGVNFADGRIKCYPTREKGYFTIYVRGNTGYGQNDFVDNGDGTITDNAAGLMWTRDDNGSGLNWEEALAWVITKNSEIYLGHDDWRLPNAKELQSIVDYTRSPDSTDSAAIDPLFNATSITNEAGQTDYPCYWSNTTHVNMGAAPGANAAYVAFGRAMGYMNGSWIDVHGAGAQRSDPKSGDPADWPTGHGPQGDAIRIYNYVRLVRDVSVTQSADTYGNQDDGTCCENNPFDSSIQ